jgi:mycothiol synthase
MSVSYRPAVDADLSAVVALINASNRADGVAELLERSELAGEWSGDRTAMATDTWLAVDGDSCVGVAYTVHLPSETVHERCIIHGTVAPDRRGQGIGRALMTWAIDHATELLRSSGRDLPRRIQVEADDQHVADQRLFVALGFEPVRWFEELRRPLTDLPAAATLEDVVIVPWPDDRDEELLEVRNASFADHWGSTPTSPSAWHHQLHGYASRPDLSFIAVDGDDRPVGICVNARYESDDEVTGRRDGWIMTLGTLAPWRGRGIASALLGASLHAFAGAGLTHAALSVDGDSPTGAARLYRALGFEQARRSTRFQLEV